MELLVAINNGLERAVLQMASTACVTVQATGNAGLFYFIKISAYAILFLV